MQINKKAKIYLNEISDMQYSYSSGDGYLNDNSARKTIAPPANSDRFNFLPKVRELTIGDGDKGVKADGRGIWIGGKTFESSPIRITMDGSIIMNDGENDRMIIGFQEGGF